MPPKQILSRIGHLISPLHANDLSRELLHWRPVHVIIGVRQHTSEVLPEGWTVVARYDVPMVTILEFSRYCRFGSRFTVMTSSFDEVMAHAMATQNTEVSGPGNARC